MNDGAFAGPAGVLREDAAAHEEGHRPDAEALAHVLADPMQPAAAARAGGGHRLDHFLLTRQVGGQGAEVALGLATAARRLRGDRR